MVTICKILLYGAIFAGGAALGLWKPINVGNLFVKIFPPIAPFVKLLNRAISVLIGAFGGWAVMSFVLHSLFDLQCRVF